jgi:ubiquinone/menaquinone biosynthesis C-methylase UbiE
MKAFAQHEMLPTATAEEQSREDFVRQLSWLLEVKLRPSLRRFYEREIAPSLEQALGQSPNRKEIAASMREVPANQAWYALRTYNQARMFNLGSEMVERQLSGLLEQANACPAVGALSLDPSLAMPSYLTAHDVHLCAGGYHRETVPGDLAVGAVYDRVISVHSMGSQGPYQDDAGASVAAWLQAKHPDFSPQRILDLGCTIGHFALPFKAAFPGATVTGVDVAAPCLRYAHARANALGVAVDFHQANAEALPFADESFDLIVSRQFLHETSSAALGRIFPECYRLLSPGGIMLHQDAPQFDELDPYTASLRDWDIHFNNEPFMGRCYELPLEELYAAAGFNAGKTFRAFAPSLFVAENQVNPHATRSAGGRYFFSGARK